MTRTIPTFGGLLVVLAMSHPSPAQDAPPRDALASFERLSQDLRGHRLSEAERAALDARPESERASEYERLVDRWLTREAIRGYVGAFLRFPPVAVVTPDAETFFHRLEEHDGVLSLPHQSTCAPEEAVAVSAWWQDEPVLACPDSYRPETLFDELGYCSGEAEPLMRQPPRPACGCGPALMGCLPPSGSLPELDRQVAFSVADEWYETAARIVAGGEPLDGLVTTTRTWQSGLIEFLYLRRELIGWLQGRAWSESVKKEVERRLLAVDPLAPARWVERSEPYVGTGLWWTSMAPHALKIPLRGTAHHLLTTHLCSSFSAVNVDADAILKAVGTQHENLRTLSSLLAAPMRFQTGCKGCHAPMDGAAAFLTEIQAPLYGSHPTGQPAEGELYVTGASDFRGRGTGIASLSNLVVAQPEFETCSVRRGMEAVLRRPLRSGDTELYEELVAAFRENGHRWRPVLVATLESDRYRDGEVNGTPRESPSSVRPLVARVVRESCVACHDAGHPLDLTELPSPDDVAVWKRILTRVSDASMPPPDTGGPVEGRFPLSPSTRAELVAALGAQLGAALDGPVAPRRMERRTWRHVALALAEPTLGAARVDALLENEFPQEGALAKLPPRGFSPAVQLAVERASETLCREMASRERLDVPELLRRIDGRATAPEEVARARGLLGRLEDASGSEAEGWIGLCATHLSSPRLMFTLYAKGDDR